MWTFSFTQCWSKTAALSNQRSFSTTPEPIFWSNMHFQHTGCFCTMFFLLETPEKQPIIHPLLKVKSARKGIGPWLLWATSVHLDSGKDILFKWGWNHPFSTFACWWIIDKFWALNSCNFISLSFSDAHLYLTGWKMITSVQWALNSTVKDPRRLRVRLKWLRCYFLFSCSFLFLLFLRKSLVK